MKTALVGFTTNVTVNLHKIKVWVKSFKKYCSNSSIYLIVANGSIAELNSLNDLGISVVNIGIDHKDLFFINHKRLLYTKNLLLDLKEELILITDVFDVIFQNDPFLRLDIQKFDLFFTIEGIKIKQSPWNSDVINKIFPEHLKACIDQEVICSGIIAGKRQHLINLLSSMYYLCEKTSNAHNIKDQAALIVLAYSMKSIDSKIKYMNLNDAWVVNCAVAGPTKYFENWGFKKIITTQYKHIPILENGYVGINNDIYDIVHQFNRIPNWHRELTKNYE